MYLELLHKFQTELRVHLANKLSDRHIFFENKKMKVKLAAQLFSNSVATAINLCRTDPESAKDTNYEFKGSKITEIFLKNRTDASDFLNTAPKFDPCPTRNPITLDNLSDLKVKTNNLIAYFKNLEFESEVRKRAPKNATNIANNTLVSAAINTKGRVTYSKLPEVLTRLNSLNMETS